MKDYANQFNKPRTRKIEALSLLVTALIVLVIAWVMVHFNINLCSDVIGGRCV